MITASVTKKRSLSKAFTYRFICSAETWVVTSLTFGAYFAFSEWWAVWLPWFMGVKGVSLLAAIVLFFTKVGTYYFHDRVWTHVRWGQIQRTREQRITRLENAVKMLKKGHDPIHCKCPVCKSIRG